LRSTGLPMPSRAEWVRDWRKDTRVPVSMRASILQHAADYPGRARGCKTSIA
jgi:hypothetical protein